ncbi:plasma membrane ATPase [Piptocephalis cylindrospora]|uniref:Plasma membrane ATPase n=1 Tax=Piptocephalis cylindrospora TaxID=1907219 RepID=A0A4P9Y2A4_9FUNG|nr:plasma membrane ATPase [Piptocephalis cylindrospora]|eukprot:RKP12814.1 plasma membrane ATPase [Piptocephalis cylindrospora]
MIRLAPTKTVEGHEQALPEHILQTDAELGLTDQEAKSRVRKYGHNELHEEKKNYLLQIALYFYGPIQSLIFVAAILAGAFQDWIDFGLILGLLLLNAVVGFLQEYQAGSTIDQLKATLALNADVIRDSTKQAIEARDLVPGDILVAEEGDIVPADARILGDNVYMQVDQSSITGESMAARKNAGDVLYSSSTIRRGRCKAIVISTGDRTFVGKAAKLVSGAETEGHFTKVINSIGRFLVKMSCFSLFIAIFSNYYRGQPFVHWLHQVLVLLIASVPIALPAVTTTTMAVGAQVLAKKQAIVSKLSAIESLAGVDILCSDKTGTLTRNKLTLRDPFVLGTATVEDLMLSSLLASASSSKSRDAIDKCVYKAVKREHPTVKQKGDQCQVIEFNPFDPVSKKVSSKVVMPNGDHVTCAKGAPQSVLELSTTIDPRDKKEYEDAIAEFASRGFRSVGVAWKRGEEDWQVLGILSLYDPPRFDTKETVRRATELGLSIKMLTGDQLAIAKDTSQQLGLGHANIYDAGRLGLGTPSEHLHGSELHDFVEGADGFAQVYPEHKYQVVDILQKRGHLVAMTGDGVNDAPSLKVADVGIAVEGATDAARSAADIVFVAPGLSVIIDAIINSRRIFHRMRGYCQYRIALSMHLVIYLVLTILILDWYLTLTLLVFAALFSDIAVLTIAYDRAPYSEHPVNWNVPGLMGLSFAISIVLVIGTWIIHTATLVADDLKDHTNSIVFLEIVLTQNWLIFSTRTKGAFYSYLPSWELVLAVFVVDVIATLMAGFGWFSGESLYVLTVIKVYFFSAGVFIVCDAVRQLLDGRDWFNRLCSGQIFKSKANNRANEDRIYALAREAARHEFETRGAAPITADSSTTTDVKA